MKAGRKSDSELEEGNIGTNGCGEAFELDQSALNPGLMMSPIITGMQTRNVPRSQTIMELTKIMTTSGMISAVLNRMEFTFLVKYMHSSFKYQTHCGYYCQECMRVCLVDGGPNDHVKESEV